MTTPDPQLPTLNLHILHLTPYYAPAYPFGGVVRAVEALAVEQSRQGHRVTVLTTNALSHTERFTGAREELRDGVRIVRAPNLSPLLRARLNLGTPLGIGRRMRELIAGIDGVDVVHTHELRTWENLLALRPVPLPVPVVLSPHGTLDPTTGRGAMKRLWDRLLTPATARRIAGVLALTDDETADVRALWESVGVDAPPVAVIPNGIDLGTFEHLPGGEAFRAKWGIPAGGRVILFMARLHPRKGAHLLAEAFAALDLPDTWLVIAGGDEGGLGLIRPHLTTRTVLTGYLAGEERLAALAAAQNGLFVLPAVGEGQPMGAIEALAAGVPALLSPGCHLPDVERMGAGWVVEPTVTALVDGLRAWAGLSPAEHDAMRAAAGAYARQFAIERTAARAVDFYHQRMKVRQDDRR